MCVGIDLCNKKNCLEQERCVFYNPLPIQINPQVKKGKKHKYSKKKEGFVIQKKKCHFGKIPCKRVGSCLILGQCILEHSLIIENPDIKEKIYNSTSILTILKILNKLKPPITLRGEMKNYQRKK